MYPTTLTFPLKTMSLKEFKNGQRGAMGCQCKSAHSTVVGRRGGGEEGLAVERTGKRPSQ